MGEKSEYWTQISMKVAICGEDFLPRAIGLSIHITIEISECGVIK